MSLRTPIARVLGSGAAGEGTDHWWSQRVTAVALLILGGWLLVSLTRLDDFAFADLYGWAGSPFNSLMLLILGPTAAWHSALGVQVVIEDYVHSAFLKVSALLINKFVHIFLAAAAVLAVLKITLGSSV